MNKLKKMTQKNKKAKKKRMMKKKRNENNKDEKKKKKKNSELRPSFFSCWGIGPLSFFVVWGHWASIFGRVGALGLFFVVWALWALIFVRFGVPRGSFGKSWAVSGGPVVPGPPRPTDGRIL